MVKALCGLLFGIMFSGLMVGVILFIINTDVQTNRMTPVIMVFCGMFTIIFGMASLVETKPGDGGAGKEDLHRAYQAGYYLVDQQNQRYLEYQERAYRAQLAAQERQHATTVNAFVTLSLADKQIINRGLEAGMRLVTDSNHRHLLIQHRDGHTQNVAEFDDMTPTKLKYMAQAQERYLALPGPGPGPEPYITEGQFRELR